MSDGLRQVEQARAGGVPSTPHMGSGLHVFQAATLHFAAACDGAGSRQVTETHSTGDGAGSKEITETHSTGGGARSRQVTETHSTGGGGEYLQEYQAGLAKRGDLIGTSAWRYADGGFALPDAPGLGVEIDEETLARYVVQ